MACIHRGVNELENKLRRLQAEHKFDARQARFEHRRNLRRNRIWSVVALVICAAIFVALMLNGEIAEDLKRGATNGIGRAGDWLMEGRPFALQYEEIGTLREYPFLVEAAIVVFRTFMHWIMIALGFCVSLLSWPLGWLCWLMAYGLPILGAAIALMGLFDWYGRPEEGDYETGEDAILRAGIEGEQKALDIVAAGLDGQCHVFANLIVPFDGETSETDLIAVTPSGVTVIEVKNYKGIICGDLSDHDLIHRKVLRSGKTEDSAFYNPVRQVGTHVYRLAGYLREQGLSVHVNGCVLFVHDEVQFSLTDREGISAGKCPVFHVNSARQLHRTLHSAQTQLDGKQLNAVVTALDGLTGGSGARYDDEYDVY